MFYDQREATKGMSVTQRETWLLKDTALEGKTFDDGAKKHELNVNKAGWTVGNDALRATADTRDKV